MNKPGIHYTSTVTELIHALAELPAEHVAISWCVGNWRCQCHPGASWGYFSNGVGCPISDLNYANLEAVGGPTYGQNHATLADLEAAHGPLHFYPHAFPTQEFADAVYAAAAKTEATPTKEPS